jgi:hypothetical protein
MDKSYKYLGYFLMILIPLTIMAFFKTYIVQFPNFEPGNNWFIHIHAFIATVWISMLIMQPFLILNRKFAIHRTVGKFSYIVFPLLILSFIPQIIRLFNSEKPENVFFPGADCILLIIFYSTAIYNRRISPIHMRYMIATALVFLGPTIGRIGPIWLGWSEILTQNVQYTIIYSILISLIFYDKSNGKDYKPYLVAVGFFLIHQIVFHFIFL